MARRDSLQSKIEKRIAERGDTVVLTREFLDMGSRDAVLRALRGMMRDKKIARIGYGVYGVTGVSRLSGRQYLLAPGGLTGAARATLTKLGVDWRPSKFADDYNSGRSTQVPFNSSLRVKGRFSRKISFGANEVEFVRE